MRLLLALVAAHFLVDTVASVINPLWPALQKQTGSGDAEFLWPLVCWNLSTSVTQIGFGLWGDRARGRWLIWFGPGLSILCLCLLGFAQSAWGLSLIVSLAGLGIAAFHPEAASQAGNCLPLNRSRAISLFQLGGFLGQSAGPYYSGQIVQQWGMSGLFFGLIWMLVLIGVMRWAMRPSDQLEPSFAPAPVHLAELFRGQVLRLLLLLVVGVLRILPAAGVPMALAFLESAGGSSTADIGLVQSAFTFGIGFGGLYCGVFMPRQHERLLLWLLPLVAAPLIWFLPQAGSLLLLASVATGLLLGSTLPILISLGQQLLPRSQRVGSSITMGLSWGLGGGISGLIVMALKRTAEIPQAFPIFAACAVASSVLCLGLLRFHSAIDDANSTAAA